MLKLVHSAGDDSARTADVDDQALAWVVRLSSGESSEKDHAAFRAWRDSSAERLAALRRARALWLKVGCSIDALERRRKTRLSARTRRFAQASLAATLLVGIAIGAYWQYYGRFDYVTARGERRVVALSDGTRLMLSGDTALAVENMKGVRRIHVGRGEARFAVHDAHSSPFIVIAGSAKYRDIGTIFSVAADGRQSRLVVASGLVEASQNERRVLVRAGQALAVGRAKMGAPQDVDVAATLAWTRDRLILKNRSLDQIVEELRPHYAGRIFFVGNDARRLKFSAAIDLHHVDNWLDTLGESTDVRVRRLGSFVFLG